jgi:hypothetical protein
MKRRVDAARLRLLSSPLRRSDSGANRSAMRSRAGCLMPPCPILSLMADDCGSYHHLTSAALSPFPLLRCAVASRSRCRRQKLNSDASRSASTSSFLADTARGPSSLQLPSLTVHRHGVLAHDRLPRVLVQRHPPCPSHHPDTDARTKFPPLECPSRHLLLPSLRSAPREHTLALPPHRVVTSLSSP